MSETVVLGVIISSPIEVRERAVEGEHVLEGARTLVADAIDAEPECAR